ncbi:hypothetical protein FEM48_Zijuj08G0028800 [Ziziphus jujuba var. spinosa]|uniref:Protein FATTY ACID EXPORT 2, chloroplastic n=1 Tax=Ziziphus jujuba var. spinosa TaxID=714518 RepID=A0A978UWK4_ZIZJJ|nr:hypothetical protein FEM48_Zijuj08G0028800 [Ziziphus jujuba var. spinosa]
MAETLCGVSQSSLLLRPKIGLLHSDNRGSSISSSGGGRRLLQSSPLKLSRHQGFQASFGFSTSRQDSISVGVVSGPTASSNLSVDSGTKEVDIELDSGSGGGGGGSAGDGDGGGRGGGGGGGGNEGEGEDRSDGKKKKMALSMSQKLTLGYAALVGVGGLMGYLKSGSQKSLLSGGLSAAVLYYVYTKLPTSPVVASSIGFGLSAALLFVMGSRFKSSGKIFPAGVVSLVSLVMTGGYLHGILRSAH